MYIKNLIKDILSNNVDVISLKNIFNDINIKFNIKNIFKNGYFKILPSDKFLMGEILNVLNKESMKNYKCFYLKDSNIKECIVIGVVRNVHTDDYFLILNYGISSEFKKDFKHYILDSKCFTDIKWKDEINENWEETLLPKNQLGHFRDKDTQGIALGQYGRKYFGAKPFINKLPHTN
jgi:hypothetical protein